MNNTIKIYSSEYQEAKAKLSKAANNGNLVIFIGAGISKLCGFPLWNETCNMLIDHCVNQRWLSNEEGEQIRKCSDPIMKMSQCRKHITEKAFDQFLKGVFGKDVPEEYNADYQRLKKALRALSSVIVTTNIDEVFDGLCEKENRFYSTQHIENIRIIKGGKRQIWHIHGGLPNIKEIVFTEDQYKERYSDEKVIAAFKRFFDSNNCTVLFVGYGLGDTELLPYFVGDLKNRKNHYFIKEHDKNKEDEFEKICKKCDERGIQVLEYDLEDGGYKQIIKILENLAEYMNLESIYPTVRFDDISRLLIEKPDEESIEFVCEELYSLLPQHQSWFLHNVSMEGCNPEWLIVFLKDPKLKQLFSVDNDIPSDDSDDKEPWNIKNIRFLLDGYRNRKSSILLPYIEEIVIGLVKRMETDKKLFKNKGIVLCIISNSFISEKVISEPSMLAFWNNTDVKDCRPYIFEYMNDKLLECSLEVRESYFYLAFDVILNERDWQYLIDGKAVNTMLHCFGDDNALERFEKAKEKIVKHDEENYGPFFQYGGFRDCFDNIRKRKCGSNDKCYANEYSAIRIMIHEMTKIPDDRISVIYHELHNSKSKFDKILAIYLCNIRFDVLEESFFDDIFDCCDYDKQLEIYSLLYSHKDEIDDKYIDKVYQYIKRIISDADTWNFLNCKLMISFCELFESRCPELRREKETFIASLSEDMKRQMDIVPGCLEVTADGYNSVISKYHKDEKEMKIKEVKSWNELLKLVIENDYDDYAFEIREWLVSNFDICDFDVFLFDTAFSINRYPAEFIKDCFEIYMNKTRLQEEKLISYLSKIECHSDNLKLVCDLSNYLAQQCNMNQLIFASGQFKNFWKALFDYSMENKRYFYFDDSWVESKEIFNAHGFRLLRLLIWTADKEDWDKLKAAFHETIKEENEDSVVIRAAYAYSMTKIYILDQEYLYSILHSIFYGSNQGLMVDLFLNRNQITEPSFFEELDSQGILSLIVSYQSKIDGVTYFLSFLVALFIKGKLSEKTLDIVLSNLKEQNIVLGGILKLKEQANELNEDEVKRIKTVLTKIEEARGVCFDALVILLLEMMKSSFQLKKYIWEDVLELAKRGFKDTYLGEVKKYFCEESFLTNEEKIILLESVLKKGEINELYNNEIVQIFDSIDWSKDKDRFHELIVIIQRQNMELSGQLMRQFQLKYERRKL